MSEKSKIAEREEEILKFWQENKIFEKSLEKPAPKGEFVFYEGPPTANGKPGIHHLEARAFKDVIPRYKTMQGFHVRRKGGWDTHGLPVELQVEKELGLKSKKEIESYGVEKFNKKCKESVWKYVDLWEKFTDRIGYWVDQKNPYITYKNYYIEAVWNILKKVEERKLLYKDYKVVPWCPRCGTGLSSHELAQGYEDVKDLSVYIKFKIVGKENSYLLAWTTTPWTLPGNVALAVGEKVEYVKIKVGEEFFILAKSRLSIIDENYEIIEEIKSKNLVGLKYEPLYFFLSEKFGNKNPGGFEKSYQVYMADFVNTEDGTGIVHTAVMYGQDDFELGTKIGLPKFHLVTEDGNFIEECDFLSGRFVKDESVAVDIIKDLSRRNLLFKKEKYEHSYPHCWRCKTPLIYYARDSWYIKMSNLRDELVKENGKINWVPAHIKDGRFGEWLREVKDWAISRERYWATPLPIWQNEEGKNYAIGSIEELKKYTKKSGNKYFVMRHGEAEHNIKNIVSCNHNDPVHLTEKGKKEVEDAISKLKNEKITIIYASPFVRAQETVSIILKNIGLQADKVFFDERIKEINAGNFQGKEFSFINFFKSVKNFDQKIDNGESPLDVCKRVGEFLYEIDKKHENENILIVSHGIFFEVIGGIIKGSNQNESLKFLQSEIGRVNTGQIKTYNFIPLPHNENYELDLHRPYVDEIELVDEKGNELKRVKEVMDVWFDSGAMPFAQDGLETKNKIQYPADFISEAVDQTRGWFYTLHAIGVLMEKGRAYKNVICLGHILDSEGKKMSKSLGNIVDPWLMMDKYGVDALRMWMYTVNQPGDSKNFDEKTVDEIVKKIFNLTENILSFYEIYKDNNIKPHNKSEHILDKWILSNLNKLIKDGSKSLDRFQVFEAGRLIRSFIGDFSTWYIRRSRDRFKSEDISDKKNVLATTRFVLLELAKYMAPFTPFFAEHIYSNLKSEKDFESVHLCNFPEIGETDEEILKNMEEVRKIVSLALEKRMSAGIKVRQPLGKLKIKRLKDGKNEKLGEEYLELIKDEVNVKEIIFDEKIEEVELDTEITEELQKEGNVREIIRAIQGLRKEKNLMPIDEVELLVETDNFGKDFLNSVYEQIKKPTNVSKIIFENSDGEELKIENMIFKISLNHNT